MDNLDLACYFHGNIDKYLHKEVQILLHLLASLCRILHIGYRCSIFPCYENKAQHMEHFHLKCEKLKDNAGCQQQLQGKKVYVVSFSQSLTLGGGLKID